MDMGKAGVPPLDQKSVNQLLDLLSTDDQFRELFVGDVVAALAQVGYEAPKTAFVDGIPQAGPGSCWITPSLASKEKIVRERQKLESVLSLPFSFTCPTGFIAD